MRLVVCALAATIPVTWLLMVFWNSLGMQLSYWDTVPLSGASIFLLFVLISVMSMDFEPLQTGRNEDTMATIKVEPTRPSLDGGVAENDPWRGLLARPALATGQTTDPSCKIERKPVGRGIGEGFDGPRLTAASVTEANPADPAIPAPPPCPTSEEEARGPGPQDPSPPGARR